MSPHVATALAEMREGDPQQASLAEVAWQRVDGSEDASLVSQWRVQSFCWLDLPRDRALGPPPRVADALADLLDRMSLTRYADIARGEQTRAVLDAAAESDTKYRLEAEHALHGSGIRPPDTELLSWAYRCGPSEATAYVRVADALELAVQVGAYVPGRPRWRQRREDITNRVLATERPELDGRAPYEGIVAERVLAWTRGSGSPTRERLLAQVEGRLAQSVGAPDPAKAQRLLARLDGFLQVIGDGAPLTVSGYLKPATVDRCVEEIGLGGEVVGVSRREGDVQAVLCLREAAQRLGLVRRHAGRLAPTVVGRSCAEDATQLWRQVVAKLVPDPGARGSGGSQASVVVWDVLLTALLDESPWRDEDVVDVCHAVLDESGWRLSGGSKLTLRIVRELFVDAYLDLHWLGLIEPRADSARAGTLLATSGASSLFLAALRHHVLHSRTLIQVHA